MSVKSGAIIPADNSSLEFILKIIKKNTPKNKIENIKYFKWKSRILIIFDDKKEIGYVTSKCFSPRLEKNIGYAFIPIEYAKEETQFTIRSPYADLKSYSYSILSINSKAGNVPIGKGFTKGLIKNIGAASP